MSMENFSNSCMNILFSVSLCCTKVGVSHWKASLKVKEQLQGSKGSDLLSHYSSMQHKNNKETGTHMLWYDTCLRITVREQTELRAQLLIWILHKLSAASPALSLIDVISWLCIHRGIWCLEHCLPQVSMLNKQSFHDKSDERGERREKEKETDLEMEKESVIMTEVRQVNNSALSGFSSPPGSETASNGRWGEDQQDTVRSLFSAPDLWESLSGMHR